jgi:hypothetical protein
VTSKDRVIGGEYYISYIERERSAYRIYIRKEDFYR